MSCLSFVVERAIKQIQLCVKRLIKVVLLGQVLCDSLMLFLFPARSHFLSFFFFCSYLKS